MPDVFISDEKQPLHKKQAEQPKGNTVISSQALPFFAAYSHMPQGIELQNQDQDEQIVLFLRKHFTKNLSWISLSIVLLLLPIIFLLPLGLLTMLRLFIPLNFILVFVSFYYLIVLGFIYVNFVTWFYNVGVITTKQLIDVDFTDIMYRDVAKARINEVIDVEFKQGGFSDSFFDFGDVFVQTQGSKPNFEFISVPHPDKVTDIIIGLKEQTHD
jgi:hypothetical protein